MGKGGLLPEALGPLAEHGGVYLAIVGGAAALQTTQIAEIEQVEWEDLMPECLWKFRVKDFGPLIVGMDTHGESLYENVQVEARKRLEESIYSRL
jgi:L(+)-tartrate dehydratase beta subunit